MNVHKNARLAVHSRAVLVRRGLSEGQSPQFGVFRLVGDDVDEAGCALGPGPPS